jgi:hypothetical protein
LPDVFNLTPGRRKVKKLTGDVTVPILVTDDGEVVAGERDRRLGRARPRVNLRFFSAT